MSKEKLIVYMVDDDADDLEMLSEAFEESGCASEIKCFTSGTDLLDLMALRQTGVPDIIILDHYLSIKDETDMPGIIRSEKKNDNITLVIYSSALSPGKIEQLLQKGVDVCRQKGSGHDELKLDVEAFCEAVKNKQKMICE
jgi:CheY-like chemotaxis protein